MFVGRERTIGRMRHLRSQSPACTALVPSIPLLSCTPPRTSKRRASHNPVPRFFGPRLSTFDCQLFRFPLTPLECALTTNGPRGATAANVMDIRSFAASQSRGEGILLCCAISRGKITESQATAFFHDAETLQPPPSTAPSRGTGSSQPDLFQVSTLDCRLRRNSSGIRTYTKWGRVPLPDFKLLTANCPLDTIAYPRCRCAERSSCRVAEGFGPDDATTTGSANLAGRQVPIPARFAGDMKLADKFSPRSPTPGTRHFFWRAGPGAARRPL
jgi:hypothetical protein